MKMPHKEMAEVKQDWTKTLVVAFAGFAACGLLYLELWGGEKYNEMGFAAASWLFVAVLIVFLPLVSAHKAPTRRKLNGIAADWKWLLAMSRWFERWFDALREEVARQELHAAEREEVARQELHAAEREEVARQELHAAERNANAAMLSALEMLARCRNKETPEYGTIARADAYLRALTAFQAAWQRASEDSRRRVADREVERCVFMLSAATKVVFSYGKMRENVEERSWSISDADSARAVLLILPSLSPEERARLQGMHEKLKGRAENDSIDARKFMDEMTRQGDVEFLLRVIERIQESFCSHP